MLKRKVIIKKADNKKDKFWRKLVDVFVINLQTWFLDKSLTRYWMQESNWNIYWKFIDLNWKLLWKQFLTYYDFKRSFLKDKKDYDDDFIEIKQKQIDDYFEDNTIQLKINKNFKKVLSRIELFQCDNHFFEKKISALKKEELIFNDLKINEIKKHFLFSAVYWTTKMENSKLSDYKARRIFDNKDWAKWCDEREFLNLKKAFKELWKINVLDLSMVKKLHFLACVWLDEISPPDELNYKPWVFRSESVLMLWQYQTPLFKNIWTIVDLIFINSERLSWLWKIIYIHLFFYLLHPFYNWNKRVTRILEYFFFREEFSDVYDKFIWMWYYFFKEKKAYFSFINQILISNYSEKSIKDFINFYIFSFNEMLELSLKEIKIKEIQDNKNFSNELEKEFNEFLLRNEIFKLSDLRIFLNKKLIKKNMLKSISLEEELKKDNNVELIDIDWKIFQSKIYVK